MLGIIDVGGGVRGAYGAGIFDYCMEKKLNFDYCIGISAGSANISSFLAGQIGRCYRSYTEYMFKTGYMGVGNFLKSHGNYIDLDYIYSTLGNHDGELALDYEAMHKNPARFLIIATNADSGEAEYFDAAEEIRLDEYDIIKASCCVPVLNKPYPYKGKLYYDGGISDPIPVARAMQDGCDRVVVILTRPRDFYRNPEKDVKLAGLLKHHYPKAAEAMMMRAERYNRELDLCKEYEKEGRVLLLAPDSIEGLNTLTKDQQVIKNLYAKGHRDAQQLSTWLGAAN